MLDHGDERIEIAATVHDADRFIVFAELAGHQDFEKLFVRADPAGQDEKCVAMLGKQALALVHGVHDNELITSGVAHFAVHQAPGNDADGPATGRARSASHFSHQTNASAAEYQRHASSCQLRPNDVGRRVKFRVEVHGARAVHGDRIHKWLGMIIIWTCLGRSQRRMETVQGTAHLNDPQS